jgi:predicted nuclease with TOPRIM domain
MGKKNEMIKNTLMKLGLGYQAIRHKKEIEELKEECQEKFNKNLEYIGEIEDMLSAP